MLKWVKDFTMRILKWAIVSLILILIVNGLTVDVKFSGDKSREKTLDLLGKVREGITVASSVRNFIR